MFAVWFVGILNWQLRQVPSKDSQVADIPICLIRKTGRIVQSEKMRNETSGAIDGV